MSSTIQESTACDSVTQASSLADTCDQIIRGKIPNLLRLYLNPYVAQACHCLSAYIKENWSAQYSSTNFQVFLANSLEEALSGAVKLARYICNATGYANAGIILDPSSRLEHFASTQIAGQGGIQFIPELGIVSDASILTDKANECGFVALFHAQWKTLDTSTRKDLEDLQSQGLILIVITDREHLPSRDDHQDSFAPDIVVFDESFVNHEVPLGSFAARKDLYEYWNRRGMATFHSTTYQPNTISSLHLMNCLRANDPALVERYEPVLGRIENDLTYRKEMFRDLYSPSLTKLIELVGFDQENLSVDGHYVVDAGRKVFDGVAGVACSVRGHNPPSYLEDVAKLPSYEESRTELDDRLHKLSGLAHAVPAVSGASAVEHALKLALACQYPRDYVLALQGGFGGKTLFALTGTWKEKLKAGLTPLYPNVVYVDPFANDAVDALESAFTQYPIGVVQCELIQGVGGVRPIPEKVIHKIDELRNMNDTLLFVDEVQTGMYRTGPFVHSQDVGIQPDLISVGKAASDMMFPFAMTLYGDKVHGMLQSRNCNMADIFRTRFGYEFGYKTMLNTLVQAEQNELESQIRSRAELFEKLLKESLGTSGNVVDVRTFGLLIGIELKPARVPISALKKLIPRLYLLGMLHHTKFPMMMGFCQYDPYVLKFTPPLSVTEEEVHQLCDAISSVLSTSWPGLVRKTLTRKLFAL